MLNQTNVRAGLAKVVEPVARGLLRIGLSPDAVTGDRNGRGQWGGGLLLP